MVRKPHKPTDLIRIIREIRGSSIGSTRLGRDDFNGALSKDIQISRNFSRILLITKMTACGAMFERERHGVLS